MHRLREEYQRNGRGPNKRFYFSHRCHWSGEQWREELCRDPHEGGLACTPLDWEQTRQDYARDCELGDGDFPFLPSDGYPTIRV
eukprot:9123699-Pyramimonas_sp.AAC.1